MENGTYMLIQEELLSVEAEVCNRVQTRKKRSQSHETSLPIHNHNAQQEADDGCRTVTIQPETGTKRQRTMIVHECT